MADRALSKTSGAAKRRRRKSKCGAGGKFTAGTAHLVSAIPKNWEGSFVKITVTGGNLAYFFSSNSAAEVDYTAAAADAGASGATVGDYLADGATDHVIVPECSTGIMYFVCAASAASTVVRLRRAS